MKVKSLSHVRLSVTPWTAAYQAPPSMGSSRQENWSGVPLPSPLSGVQLCNPWTAAHLASLSFSISRSLLKLMSIESVMPSNHLILCHRLLLLPSIFPSLRVFPNEWPKYWSFSISPSNEYLELISFRIDWFEPLGPRDSQESSPVPQFESTNWLSSFYMI